MGGVRMPDGRRVRSEDFGPAQAAVYRAQRSAIDAATEKGARDVLDGVYDPPARFRSDYDAAWAARADTLGH